MKSNYFFYVWLCGSLSFAQVGIGTEMPKATLDVVGEPMLANVMDGVIPPRLTGDQLSAKNYTADQQGAIVYVTSAASDLQGQVAYVDALGLYHFDGVVWKKLEGEGGDSGSGNTVFFASKKGGWTLANIGFNNWDRLDLSELSPKYGGGNVNETGDYVAPSSGYYQVVYEWQLSAGININVLGSKYIAIVKNRLTDAELVDSKVFDAIRMQLGVFEFVSVPLTSTTMTSMVKLKKGDQLSFVFESGFMDVGLLNETKIVIHIHKVANDS